MSKRELFFTIITCSKNSSSTIINTINSVKKQSFTDYQHIFIDGNSTDNTVNIINKYKCNNQDKVKLFQFPSKGISDAMNIGIDKSKGKYLIHLHSDDSFFSSKVLKDVHDYLLKNPNLDWVYGKINIIDQDINQNIGTFPNRKIFQIASQFLLELFNFIPHQAVFIKKSVFKKFGLFDTNFKIAMDYDFWMKIHQVTRWKFTNIIVSNYGISQNSTSSKISNRSRGIFEYHQIHKKYLSYPMYLLSEFVLFIINKFNKTYR
ncbi:MAG: glycosyltransferase family 2 protein [Candidatus Shapirobacteria bacterium]|jgi:glycosyltransferase involved in cell wall biosynthesis